MGTMNRKSYWGQKETRMARQFVVCEPGIMEIALTKENSLRME